MNVLLTILKLPLLPLDLLFLTVDTLRGLFRMMRQPRESPCAFCGQGGAFNDEVRTVQAARKYINLWVFRILCPCVEEKDPEVLDQRFCRREDMFAWRKRNVLLSTVLLGALWSVAGGISVRSGLAHTVKEGVIALASRTGSAAEEAISEKERQRRVKAAAAAYSQAQTSTDPNQKIDLLEKVISNDPDHTDARMELIQVVIDEQDLDRALGFADQARDAGVEDPRLHLHFAIINARLTRREIALEEAQRARPDINDDPDLLQQAALAFQLAGKASQSRACLERAVEVDPEHLASTVMLAALHLQSRDTGKAWALYDALKDAARALPEARTLHAELLLREGDAKGARDIYEAVIQEHPEYLDAYTRLSTLYRANRQEDRTKAIAEQLTTMGNQRFRHAGHIILAQLYDEKGLFDDALEHAEAVLKDSPNNLAAMVSKGNALYKKRDFAKAARLMEKLREYAPGYLKAQYLLARCHMHTGQDVQVEKVLRTLIEKEPDSAVPVIELANYFYEAKRYKEAWPVYEDFLARHPDNAICINNLAVTLAEGNLRLDRALQLAQFNYDRDAANPIYADALGWVLVRLERPEEAIPLLKIAIRGIPGHAEPHYHLGHAYLQQGDKAQAMREFKTALSLSKEFTGIADARRQLTELLTEDP